ncbi:MAG TPA: PepSY-associated TM helix domain-containing protein [Candidatus Sulfotelmatobacter sp.]|nr:PepSY-associated TM helix domain-containing protein [Candidatus Sulfotelmatobacter sp.]
MNGQLNRVVRDLHLYLGLFVSPFVLAFAISVLFLVHAWLPKAVADRATPRVVANLPLPADLEQLSGRARIDALKPALDWAGVQGEVGWVQHQAKENRLILPVTVPGRVTTVTIDVGRREAIIEARTTGLADALVVLHKSPGPHLVGMRMNWFPMQVWRWLADATVYLLLFLTLSGVYLWYVVRAERKIGFALLAAGAFSFFGLVYALVH